MELRTPTYQQHLPTEESLWKNRGVGHRLWKAWSIGAITGAFTSAVVGYWYDYPVLTAKDGYKSAFMGSLKLTGKYALGFSAASLIFQATTEFVNAYQQKRTVLGPFLGGIASVLSIGLMTKNLKTSLAMGAVAGVGCAYFGHVTPFSLSMRFRERAAEKYEITEKFRYLKNLEHREAREAARLSELAALKEFEN